jgi:hypothetical protein
LIHYDRVRGFFRKIFELWLDLRKFTIFSIKLSGPCISSCKVQVCWICMDHGLIIIIKLHERWLDRGRCRQIF